MRGVNVAVLCLMGMATAMASTGFPPTAALPTPTAGGGVVPEVEYPVHPAIPDVDPARFFKEVMGQLKHSSEDTPIVIVILKGMCAQFLVDNKELLESLKPKHAPGMKYDGMKYDGTDKRGLARLLARVLTRHKRHIMAGEYKEIIGTAHFCKSIGEREHYLP